MRKQEEEEGEEEEEVEEEEVEEEEEEEGEAGFAFPDVTAQLLAARRRWIPLASPPDNGWR